MKYRTNKKNSSVNHYNDCKKNPNAQKKVRGISNSDKKAKGLAGKYDKVQNRLANAEKKNAHHIQ